MMPEEHLTAARAQRLHDVLRAAGQPPYWVITASPRDYPGQHIARLWLAPGRPACAVLTAPTLASLEAMLPAGLSRIAADPRDDAVLVATWVDPSHEAEYRLAAAVLAHAPAR